MWKRVAKLKEKRAIAEKREFRSTPDWDRIINPSVVQIGSECEISRLVVEAKLKQLCEVRDIKDEEWKLLPSEPTAKHFAVQCHGIVERIAVLVDTLSHAAKNHCKWEQRYLATPGGTQSHVFFDPNQNRKMFETERATAKLGRIASEALQQKIFAKRERAVIEYKWKLLAKLQVVAENARPQKRMLSRHNLEKDKVAERFYAEIDEAEASDWESWP